MLAVQADIAPGEDNEAVVKNVVDAAIKKFGRIAVLINNAQASASGITLQDHTTEQLASPDFNYMNGETLTLEGGMGLRP